MEDLELIKKFREIKITQICKKVGVDRSNLTHERASAESVKKVADELRKELSELLKEE